MRILFSVCLVAMSLMLTPASLLAQSGADSQLDSAFAMYNKASFEDAIIKATDAITSGNLSVPQEERALRILGMASVGGGHMDQAEKYLTKLVELDPAVQLDPDENPPQIMSLWYKVRDAHPVPADAASTSAPLQTVAVMYFDNNSIVDHDDLDALSKGLASMMIYEVTKVSQLKVVERDRINFLVDELKLQQSDLVDKSTAVKIGKLAGAQTLLMGGFMKLSDKQFRIDARLVKVETGEIIKADFVEGKPDEVVKLEKELVLKILADLGTKASDAEQKAIMKGSDTSFDALYYYSRGLAFEDKKNYAAAYQHYQKALQLEPGYADAQKKMSRLEPFASQG